MVTPRESAASISIPSRRSPSRLDQLQVRAGGDHVGRHGAAPRDQDRRAGDALGRCRHRGAYRGAVAHPQSVCSLSEPIDIQLIRREQRLPPSHVHARPAETQLDEP